jgi:hypothetical protein
MTMYGAGVGAGEGVVVTLWMVCVLPLTITTEPVAGRTYVVADWVPDPGTMTVPPRVRVELPIT